MAYSKASVAQVPIKLPVTADEEKKKAARIAESVRAIMAAKTGLRGRGGKLSDRDRTTLEGEVESLENGIDRAVFALYGVDGVPG